MVVEKKKKKKQGQGGDLPTPASLLGNYEWRRPLLTKMTTRGPMSLMDVVDM
jgi:hypothetical protein